MNRPPFIALGLLLLALGASLLIDPTPWLAWPWRGAGGLPAAGGLLLALQALGWFRRRGTSHDPHAQPTALVLEGPYRITRNPMYVGVILVLVGIAVFAARWPFLLTPPLFWIAVARCFVPNEERRLEAKFGADYLAYKQRVRRWI